MMLKKFFIKFFPIPDVLAVPSFGVDISDQSLKYVELVSGKKGVNIGRYGERKIANGIIESGKITNPKQMEEILVSFKKEIGIKAVRASLPEEQIYLYKLKLNKGEIKTIEDGIEFSLEEYVPIPAEDAVFDYEVLEETSQGLQLQVTAIPKNIIDPYLSVFKNSNISVVSLELEAQAIARAVVKKGDRETYMIVDFGKKRTGISIVSNEVVMFTSTIDVGGVMLTEMIQKNFQVTFEEAEKMKLESGLTRNVANREVFSILLNGISILRDEISKHFLYWQTHRDESGKDNPLIKKIILCGGDSNLIGLSDYLSVSMKTKVEIANIWINLLDMGDSIPEISFDQSLSYVTALGLALRNFNND